MIASDGCRGRLITVGEHVPARGELRQHDELCAARDGALQRDPNALQVAVDVAENDLWERSRRDAMTRSRVGERAVTWSCVGVWDADQSSSVAVIITPTGAR